MDQAKKIWSEWKKAIITALILGSVTLVLTGFGNITRKFIHPWTYEHDHTIKQDSAISKNKRLILHKHEDSKAYTDKVATKHKEEAEKQAERYMKSINDKFDIIMQVIALEELKEQDTGLHYIDVEPIQKLYVEQDTVQIKIVNYGIKSL